MKPIKSERLKKLESELRDLDQWLKLGLVPKKDILKHREEIVSLQAKIDEEKERLRFLKESGETEEYIAPKRGQMKTGYTEMSTIPDLETIETGGSVSDSSFDMENEQTDSEATSTEFREEEEAGTAELADDESQDEESYFSDKNRWRRGGIVDPDADEW